MSKKIVAVLGATGLQGGSVVTALLASEQYHVRGITRSSTSGAAKALAEKGAEIVEADAGDKASLVKAFKDAYAVFGVTPFPDPNEVQHGKDIVDACLENKVDLFIWSTLPDGTGLSGGKYTGITHFDAKAAVDRYIKESGQPGVSLMLCNFAENLINFKLLAPGEGGSLAIYQPIVGEDVPVPTACVEADLGHVVTTVVEKWADAEEKKNLEGKIILSCSFMATGKEWAKAVEAATGKKTTLVVVPTAGMAELDEMNHFIDEGYYPKDPVPPHVFVDLGVKFTTIDEFVKAKIVPLVESFGKA